MIDSARIIIIRNIASAKVAVTVLSPSSNTLFSKQETALA